MGDLRDELIKKGLVSSRRAKELSHAEKARKKKLGKKQVKQLETRTRQQLLEREQARREADRQRETSRMGEQEQKELTHRLVQLLADHKLTGRVHGPRRFHFVSRKGTIPFLELNEQTAKGLENGEVAICDLPDSDPETFLLVPAEIARRARELDPDCVLFFEG